MESQVSLHPAESSDIFIARQPIYNGDMVVVAYELVHHAYNVEEDYNGYDEPTTEILVNSIIEIGLADICENKMAFINLSPKYLLQLFPDAIELDQLVIQVSHAMVNPDNLLDSVKEVRDQGNYAIAFKDFVFSEKDRNTLQYANYVKMDISKLSRAEVEQQARILSPLNTILIAEKVLTQNDFEFCKNMGFDLFQGYFFCEPKLIAGHHTPTSRLSILHLLAEIQKPDVSFEYLEDLIAKDVSLSYRLLRYINSASYNLPRKIDSIHQAITLLGLKTVKFLITIMAQSKFDDKPYELMITSLVRARMCELVAADIGVEHDSIFVVGLFSTLDALLDKPMNEVLESLPLSAEVNQAILIKQGPLGDVLHSVMAYEKGAWDELNRLPITNHQLKSNYLQALQWTREAGKQMLSEPAG